MWIKAQNYAILLAKLAGLEATLAGQAEMIERLNASLTKAYESRDRERKRSDNAIDRMLNVHHLPAITPPDKITLDEISSLFEETEEEKAAVLKEIEARGIEEVLMAEVR
jgi:uncharacterized coiled-coil protein SlyX